MPKPNADAKGKSKPAAPASNRAGSAAGAAQDFVAAAATLGVIAAGAALFEVALIPGIVLGGAAMLAPRYVPKVLPTLRKSLQPLFNATPSAEVKVETSKQGRPGVKLALAIPAKLAIKEALLKTITFRLIVTTLDFTSNYVVLGELGTSAGLSAFAFVVAPLLYLGHEGLWNYFGPAADAKVTVAGLRSAGPWPRPSLFGLSPQRSTSPRSMS